MKNTRTIEIKNGDGFVDFNVSECNRCGKHLEESSGWEEDDHNCYCGDCAVKLGIISEDYYLKSYCYWASFPKYIEIVNDEIHLFSGERREKAIRDKRGSFEYRFWRKRVFERDLYTCKSCSKVGGRLNAHHIMSYAKHEDSRLDVNNGVTLCKECHKKAHAVKY